MQPSLLLFVRFICHRGSFVSLIKIIIITLTLLIGILFFGRFLF